MTNQPLIQLNNGSTIPQVGLGVWQLKDGENVETAVRAALDTGYRQIDTAKIYGNESGVGHVIKNSGLKREDLYVTTKLWNEDQGYDSTLKSFDESLKRLGLDYVDLYLIHYPVPVKRRESWKALEQLVKSGKCKSIGVSNYTIKHLEELLGECEIKPVINQVEFHPFLYQKELLDFCGQNQIVLQAYSPLAHGERIFDGRIERIAEKYNKTNAQIMIRWSMQLGNVVIPKSSNPERIAENFNVFDFEITPQDMNYLCSLNENLRTCWDPSNEQ